MDRVSSALAVSVFCAVAALGGHAPTSAQEPAAPAAAAGAYLGSKSCRKCHLAQFRSWEQTKMAHTFEVLAPGQRADVKTKAGLDPAVDYRTHPECLRCHTVGFDQPGGFRLAGYDAAADPQRLLGVGCESCHGPGGAFVGPGKKDSAYAANHAARLPELVRLGYRPQPDQAACVTCHNHDSPNFHEFDFATMKAKPGEIHDHPPQGH